MTVVLRRDLPFCPTRRVGIASLPEQRFFVDDSTELLPEGRSRSNREIGTSGIAPKVVTVCWLLLIVTLPSSWMLTPLPLSWTTSFGSAVFCATRYTGPFSGAGRIGVVAL